jgi:hypothetical protein
LNPDLLAQLSQGLIWIRMYNIGDLCPYLVIIFVEPELEPQELQLFAIAEPEPLCISGTGTGFGPGSNIKSNTTAKNQKLVANFLGNNNAASSVEKARSCTNFAVLKNCVK